MNKLDKQLTDTNYRVTRAWKCNFQPFKEIMTTDRPTNGRTRTFAIKKCTKIIIDCVCIRLVTKGNFQIHPKFVHLFDILFLGNGVCGGIKDNGN